VQSGILLALIVGVVRVFLGLINAGVLAYLMSQPVLMGFSSAAAILIVSSQFELIFGLPGTDGPLLGRAAYALARPGEWSIQAIGLSIATAVIVVGGRRIHRLFPGVLAAVVVGVFVNRWFNLPVESLGEISGRLPTLQLDFSLENIRELIVPGGVIALVGFAEPAAIARTMATQDRQFWDPDREFISQGVANITSGLSGSYPVGGSFSRSSVAKLAGAQTRFAGMFSGIIVFALLPFANVLSTLPKAVLGAIVIVATVRLVKVISLVKLIRVTWGQSIVAWGTFISTLALAPRVDLGLITGIVLATAIHLRRESRIGLQSTVENKTLKIAPSGVLYFGSAPALSQALMKQLASYQDIEAVIVDLGMLGRVDYTGVQELRRFAAECEVAGLTFKIRNIPDHAMGTMTRCLGDELPRFCDECEATSK
jgi:SulP family sulfate permease